MRNILIVCFALISISGKAQVGVFGGLTTVKSLGYQGVYPGINFGVEAPKDDMISFFGRVIMTLPKGIDDSIAATAIDPSTTFPSIKYVPCRFTNSVFNIQCGTRYYLGNGYDYGLSAYGGSIFEVGTLGVRRKIKGDLDESKYEMVSSTGVVYPNKGRIFAMNLGLNAGIKYNVYFGVFFLDFTGSYSLFAFASNPLANDYSRYSQLNFTVNVGFRKDIF